MNRREHLLTILGEEGVEVAQRCSKALRFGLHEIQPGQDLTNAERIRQELVDLLAVVGMLVDELIIPDPEQNNAREIATKIAKVEKFLAYSREQGTLTE